jgi:DNA-binding PucR family transcriptional regulator
MTVVAFDDVAIAALLTEQSEDVQRWIVRVLGALAADDPGRRLLRETVRVCLESAGSCTPAVAQLYLHKNTGYYRIRKAEELLGRPLPMDRLDLAPATVCARTVSSSDAT